MELRQQRRWQVLSLAIGLAVISTAFVAWMGPRSSDPLSRIAVPPDIYPKVGDEAPDFTLTTSNGTGRVTLSSFRQRRPVVLTFGSHS